MEEKASAVSLSAAQQILLDFIRMNRSPEERAEKISKRAADWPVVIRLALHHGVMPLLYSRLKELKENPLPPEETAYLRRVFLTNAARNISMTSGLFSLLSLLDDHGVPAIPFKGPVLAEVAYGHVGMRQFSDLDLLVRRQDMRKAIDLLTSKGYRSQDELTRFQKMMHRRYVCDYYCMDGEGTKFDVQWRFTAECIAAVPDAGSMFDTQVSGSLEGCKINTLAPDDMLLHLCAHGSLHVWAKLSHICDVAMLVQTRKEWSWQSLLRKAEAGGMRRMFLLGLTLSRDLMSMRLPPEIEAAAEQDRSLEPLRSYVRERLFSGNGRREPGLMETARFVLKVLDSSRDRLRYALMRCLLPTNEDWLRIRLPDSLFFLYYFLRPLRILGIGSKRQSLLP